MLFASRTSPILFLLHCIHILRLRLQFAAVTGAQLELLINSAHGPIHLRIRKKRRATHETRSALKARFRRGSVFLAKPRLISGMQLHSLSRADLLARSAEDTVLAHESDEALGPALDDLDRIGGAHVRACTAPYALPLVDVWITPKSLRGVQEGFHAFNFQLQRISQGTQDHLRPRGAPHDVQIDRDDRIDRPGHGVATFEDTHRGSTRPDGYDEPRLLNCGIGALQLTFGLQIGPTRNQQYIGFFRCLDDLDPEFSHRNESQDLQDLNIATVTAACVKSIDSSSLYAHVPHLSS